MQVPPPPPPPSPPSSLQRASSPLPFLSPAANLQVQEWEECNEQQLAPRAAAGAERGGTAPGAARAARRQDGGQPAHRPRQGRRAAPPRPGHAASARRTVLPARPCAPPAPALRRQRVDRFPPLGPAALAGQRAPSPRSRRASCPAPVVRTKPAGEGSVLQASSRRAGGLCDCGRVVSDCGRRRTRAARTGGSSPSSVLPSSRSPATRRLSLNPKPPAPVPPTHPLSLISRTNAAPPAKHPWSRDCLVTRRQVAERELLKVLGDASHFVRTAAAAALPLVAAGEPSAVAGAARHLEQDEWVRVLSAIQARRPPPPLVLSGHAASLIPY